MVAILQTSMIAACLAILLYLAAITTGDFLSRSVTTGSSAQTTDSQLRNQIASSLNYTQSFERGMTSNTILLNGVTLRNGEFIHVYDSTPFVSKGHIAMTLPCDKNNPERSLFDLLIGEAPAFSPVNPGYIQGVSNPPDDCLYHAQFGFGSPVTDIALRNRSGQDVSFRGPHSIVLSIHESYIPTTPSFQEIQHRQQQYQQNYQPARNSSAAITK